MISCSMTCPAILYCHSWKHQTILMKPPRSRPPSPGLHNPQASTILSPRTARVVRRPAHLRASFKIETRNDTYIKIHPCIPPAPTSQDQSFAKPQRQCARLLSPCPPPLFDILLPPLQPPHRNPPIHPTTQQRRNRLPRLPQTTPLPLPLLP